MYQINLKNKKRLNLFIKIKINQWPKKIILKNHKQLGKSNSKG